MIYPYAHVDSGNVLVRYFIQMLIIQLNGGIKMTGRWGPLYPTAHPWVPIFLCNISVLVNIWLRVSQWFPEIRHSVTPRLSVLILWCPRNSKIALGHVSHNASLPFCHRGSFVYSWSFPEALGNLCFGTRLPSCSSLSPALFVSHAVDPQLRRGGGDQG